MKNETTTPPINFLLCCNDKISKYIPVIQSSLYQNIKERPVCITVAHFNHITLPEQQMIESFGKEHGQAVHFVTHDVKPFETMHTSLSPKSHYPAEIFLRLGAVDFLPDAERCLYIDIDTLIEGDISEWYDMDFNGFLLASKQVEPMGMSGKFGSGVMLLNLSLWREEGWTIDRFTAESLEFNRKGWTELGDCGFLNRLFEDRAIVLDYRTFAGWNTLSSQMKKLDYSTISPKIIHYSSRESVVIGKPWKYYIDEELFKKYKQFHCSGRWPVHFPGHSYYLYQLWWQAAKNAPNYELLRYEATLRTDAINYDLFISIRKEIKRNKKRLSAAENNHAQAIMVLTDRIKQLELDIKQSN